MKRIISKTKDIIFAKQTSILSSTLVISAMMIVARVFGYLRYNVLTNFFTTAELDLFFAAFRLPDILFEVIITGALTTTFIPFFLKYKDKPEQQTRQISTIINVFMILMAVFIAIMYVAMPYITPLLTPGFSEEKIQTIVTFSRILLLGQVPMFVAASFLTGISQAEKSFVIPAVAPVLYNLGIIIVTIMMNSYFHLVAPIIGVIAGAFCMLVVQLPVLIATGFRYSFVIAKTKDVVEFFKIIFPRVITTIVHQIDASADLALATLRGAGAYTNFYLAQHLQLLPISIVGMAFGQASLPYLTEVYQEKNIEGFKKIIIDTVLAVGFITLPFVGFFIVSRTPIVRIFFGGDKFDWESTTLTAKTLSIFALSIPFHSIYYFITRCFYAMFDSITPFIVGTVSIALNISLSVYFIQYLDLPVWSLALSFSIAVTANVLFLSGLLVKRLGSFNFTFLTVEIAKMVSAVGVSSFVLYAIQRLLTDLIFDLKTTLGVFLLVSVCGIVYAFCYIFLAWMFKVREIVLLTKMLAKVKQYQRKLSEVYTGTGL